MSLGPFFRTLCIALLLLAPIAMRKVFGQDETFPYDAIVAESGATAHSGNGEEYYATNRLEPGTPVTVYRHDPDGWHMIAPPEGAFSLVPADGIEPLDDNLAEIVADDIGVRVGNAIGDDFDVEQIPLRIGTRVELLPDQIAPQGWIAIRPPRGEYRWVQARFLTPTNSESELPAVGESTIETEAGGSNNPFDTLRELDQQLAKLEHEKPEQWPLEALSLGYQRLKRSQLDLTQQINKRLARIAELKSIRDGRGPIQSADTGELSTATQPTPTEQGRLAAEEPVRETYRPAPGGSEYYPTNITTLPSEEHTAAPMSSDLPPSAPVGSNLPEQTGPRGEEMIVARASPESLTPGSTETAPAYARIPPVNPSPTNSAPLNSSNSNPGQTAGTTEPMPTPDNATARRFDAVGYIQKAVNPPPNAPAYVLVSREGQILAYLQEPSNTTLESFVGRPMGVDGAPQSPSGLQLPLIAIERLTPVRFR